MDMTLTFIFVFLQLLLAGPPSTSESKVISDETAVASTLSDSLDAPLFTGEVLPVFYVHDVLKSVVFYKNLGFRFDHYFDSETGESVVQWTKTVPPIYAEMWAGSQRFALHLPANPDSLVVGGMRHYFGVTDVNAWYQELKKRHVPVGELIDRPWMLFFRVEDPDGHVLYFQTRKQE